MNQLGNRCGIEAKLRGGDVGQEAGAGGVIGVKEFAATAVWILLAVFEALLILGGKEGGLMMVEPPGDFWRGGVFEVDDRVLVAAELGLVKQRAGAMETSIFTRFPASFG